MPLVLELTYTKQMLSSVSADEFKTTSDGSLSIYRQTNFTQTKGGSKIRPLGVRFDLKKHHTVYPSRLGQYPKFIS